MAYPTVVYTNADAGSGLVSASTEAGLTLTGLAPLQQCQSALANLLQGLPSTAEAAAGTLTGTVLASNVVTSSLTAVGTLTTGVWNGTVILGLYGGTGVANSGKTITLGGNFVTSGAFATTITVTGTTTVTLPTSGTLVTTAVTALTSLVSVGTIGTGVWQGTVVAGQYGGTGVANTGFTITLAGNLVTSGANSLTLTTSGATNVTLPTSGTLVNSAVTTLSSLVTVAVTLGLGGTSSSFPMLKRSATQIQVRLADDSNYAPFTASAYSVGATAGVSGTITSLSTATVVNGIITAIA